MLKKYILVLIGSISLVLGFLGIFVPILPTTPFLLLASFCYIRSSRRLYEWLMNHRVFGEYIYNYITFRSVKRSTKITALLFLWLTLVISMAAAANLHLRLFLLMIGIGVSIHLLTLKTL